MKITGGINYVKFDLGNGYIMRADGKMLTNRRFVVYKNTMKSWEYPHDKENVSHEQIEKIIQKVKENISENTVQIIFE